MTDLRKILDEATPGPWKTHLVDDTTIIATDGTDVATTCDSANVERSDAYNVEYERMEADARLIALAPQLAAALIKAEDALAESVEIVHKEYVRATLETVNAGPHHLLQKQMDAWRVRCMNAEKVSRAALSEIRDLTGGNDD
jgi:hypothetical protein